MHSAPTLLVTGATGQVGQELLRRAGNNWRVIGLTRRDLDLGDASAVLRLIAAKAPAAVINAAAYTAVDRAELEEGAAMAANRDAPHHLALACEVVGVPFFHISTDYVFDGNGESHWAEDAPTAPLGIYGRSKVAGEEAVRAVCPRHVILRTAWVFSPFGNNFVKTMIRLAAERDELRVVDDQRGGPTAASSIAGALLTMAANAVAGHAAWGTYHFCSQPATTWYGFATAIMANLAARGAKVSRVLPITTAEYPLPARRPANSMLDCSRLTASWGIQPPDWRKDLVEVMDELARKEANS